MYNYLMKIDGRVIAEKIYADLRNRVGELSKNNVTPTLAVVLIGNDPGSVSYVAQKEKHAKNIGVALQVDRLPTTVTEEQLQTLIDRYNTDTTTHGIIVQRPSPKQITKEFLDHAVIPEKDVDGFHPDSPFTAPVALGVLYILKSIGLDVPHLSSKKIVILGRGETAGQPIAQAFTKLGIPIEVLHSQSNIDNPLKTLYTLQAADIIISCVGKGRVVKKEDLKLGVILVGVGGMPQAGLTVGPQFGD